MKFMKAQEHLKTMSTPRKLGFGKKTLNKSYRTKPIVIYTAVPFGDDQIANEEATSPMYRTFFRHLVILAIGGLIGYISCWFFIEALAISIENHHEFADSRRFVSKDIMENDRVRHNSRSHSDPSRYFEHYSLVRNHLPMHSKPSHHIHSKHNYFNSLPSTMYFHRKYEHSPTSHLPQTDTITVKSDAKESEEDDAFYEYYSKSDDVFNDYYSPQIIQEQ